MPSSASEKKEHPDYITTTSGMSGHFAVLLKWYNDIPEAGLDGYYDVWSSGVGRYKSSAEAKKEGLMWAKEEGIEFRE